MIAGKKAVCFSMVKNEEDIIELSIRHNVKIFDHIFITDNNSSDYTVSIIELLIKEGLPITLWHNDALAHKQSEITTKAYHRIASLMDFNLFFPLDADELLTIEDDFDVNLIQDDICYITNFFNYVTLSGNDKTIDMTHRFKKGGPCKIFVNHHANKYKKIKIEQGNHGITYNNASVEPVLIPSIRINHFGNRGLNHYFKKYIIGSQAMMILHKNYVDGKSSFATHWYKGYEFIKQHKANITFDGYIKLVYDVESLESMKKQIVKDNIFSGLELKYSHFETNLIYILISNYESLSKNYCILNKNATLKKG